MKKSWVLVAATLISSSLYSQDSSKVRSLNEVVVTATRFPKKISETGKVVSIISKQDLERAGGKDITQILNEQAGVIINGSTSNAGKDKSIYLRGAKGDYTVILINGIPVNDPTGVNSTFDLRMLPIEQIERIEILKGAQSTLYGPDAVAGVINIITKKGSNKAANLYGGISGGSYSTFKANAGLSGGSESASYNITFTHNESKGVPEAKDTNTIKTFAKNGMNENSVSADFNARIIGGLSLRPFFRYTSFKGTYADDAFTPGQNIYKGLLLSTGAQAQYTFSNGSVTAIYAYDQVSRSYTNIYGTSPYQGTKKTAETFANYNFGDYFQALAGIRYDIQQMDAPSSTIADTSLNLVSPYVSLFLKNFHGFNLELGGRYNDHSRYGNYFTYSINPSYLINNDIKVFANIGTAFRAPSISMLYGQYGSNPNLKPEKSNTLEAGFQASFLADKLDIRAVYFYRKIKDVIISNSSYDYINFNAQKDNGFEIESSIYFNRAITLKLHYAFVDGKVTTTTQGGKDTSYFNLTRIPKNSFGANLGYQITPVLYVSTNVSSYGKRHDLFFNSNTYNNDPVTLAGYTLWDIYAEYSILNKKIKFFAALNNITNTDYYEVYGYTTLGRNANAGIRVNL